MKSLRVKGFRTIRDSGTIELKPITAIIGKNSCGKSSFIRFFPLLKQSTEREISETLLWFGEYVDFSDFKSIKPNFDPSLKTSFEMEIDFSDIYRYPFWRRKGKTKTEIYLKLNIQIEEKHIAYLGFSYLDQKVELFMDQHNKVNQIIVNGKSNLIEGNRYNWAKSSHYLLPFINDPSSDQDGYIFFHFDTEVEKKLTNILNDLSPNNTDEDVLEELVNTITDFWSQKQLHQLLCDYNEIPEISKYFKNNDINDDLFQIINAYSILTTLPHTLQIINRFLQNEIENIHYLKPIRASVNRFYRIQGLNIEHVDSDGSNLAMILNNLKDSERKKFEKWTVDNFGLRFSVLKSSGHVCLIVYDNEQPINLADTGYGYSQILPIIVELWLLFKKQDNEKIITIVIEQPELHLHPAFQAKVVDLFVALINQAKANKIELKIIFETHSETMINRLGEKICQQDIDANDVNILAFEKLVNETNITPMSFNEDGLIIDWPIGFFSMEG